VRALDDGDRLSLYEVAETSRILDSVIRLGSTMVSELVVSGDINHVRQQKSALGSTPATPAKETKHSARLNRTGLRLQTTVSRSDVWRFRDNRLQLWRKCLM